MGRGLRLAERFFSRRSSPFSFDIKVLRGERSSRSTLSGSFLRDDLLPKSRS